MDASTFLTQLHIFVATKKTQGQRRNDFCWCEVGEIVMFGSECDSEEGPDDSCGCHRSLVGVKTCKATTTFEVVQFAGSLTDLALQFLTALQDSGWAKLMGSKAAKQWSVEMAIELARAAAQFPVGTVCERRGDYIQARSEEMKS